MPLRTDAVPELRTGVVAALPLVPGTIAWGIAFGAAAAGAGLQAGGAVAMSVVAWSGTAQLAAVTMLAQPLAFVFVSSLLLSLRFMPMSVALAGLLPGRPRWQRILAGCCMADASFALLAAGRFRTPAAMVGTWLPQYFSWVAGTAIGVLAAPLLPARLLEASDGLVAVIFVVLAVETAATGRWQTAIAILAAAAAAAAALLLPSSVALLATAILVSALAAVVQR
ncbi:MAG TPA: AzlC family ABC transporter permease [Candidatus Dormibacteraeota bacterium]|nr:AzlC family ABC transporter permease [Candidatus Dormibacteraeota bacterium]